MKAMQPTPAVLPPGLQGWESTLGLFADDIAVGLGSLVHALDLAMSKEALWNSLQGEPNGFDGITTKGSIEQLSISEWLLGSELPDEFVRRFAMAELHYLKPAFEQPRPMGRMVVLVDSGPDQLGARRLVQLAAILVLSRRAESRGVDLTVGVLGDAPDKWLPAERGAVLTAWLRSRRNRSPTIEDLTQRLSILNRTDAVWVLTNQSLAAVGTPAQSKQITVLEDGWGVSGPTHLLVDVDNATLRLPIPAPTIAIRILRGQGFRPTPKNQSTRHAGGLLGAPAFRFPLFAGPKRRLLCRGADDHEIVSISLPHTNAGAQSAKAAQPIHAQLKARTHRFPGRVLAVLTASTSYAGLYEIDGLVRVHVVGKKIGNLHKVCVTTIELGLDSADIEQIATDSLTPMFFDGGDLLVTLAERTFRIPPASQAFRCDLPVLSYSPVFDHPYVGILHADGQLNVSSVARRIAPERANVFLAGGYALAGDQGADVWGLWATNGAPDAIGGTWISDVAVRESSTVMGVVRIARLPYLVTLSKGRQLIRLEGIGENRMLTSLSGDVETVAVHPVEPILAVQYRDGAIRVVDLETDTTLGVLRPEAQWPPAQEADPSIANQVG
jgi:hypothetical protein